jgi:triacylglycerol esterase/lipase EstA (alpha/beta hydrolase family)
MVVASMLAAVVVASPAAHAAGGNNDFGCRPSAAHPEPVILLHGSFATYYEDLNFLQSELAAQGYCTFSFTYGSPPGFPLVGGTQPISVSAQQVDAYIEQVRAATGAAKVDLVGHSQGGFLALYVPKIYGIGSEINADISIAPPTHGLSSQLLIALGEALVPGGDATITRLGGDTIFTDLLTTGPAVVALNSNGPITQPGVKYTVIASRYDEFVEPPATASFIYEPGVANEYVQDSCPFDPVGHIGEAYDTNVWHLVENALSPATATPISPCSVGSPG